MRMLSRIQVSVSASTPVNSSGHLILAACVNSTLDMVKKVALKISIMNSAIRLDCLLEREFCSIHYIANVFQRTDEEPEEREISVIST